MSMRISKVERGEMLSPSAYSLNDFDIVSTFQHSNKISVNNKRPHTSSETKPIGNPEITSLDMFLGEKYYRNIDTIDFA